MIDPSHPFRHLDVVDADDDTLARDARAHLARSPHVQVIAELFAKLRSSGFPWWSFTFTRTQWRVLPRMQWLAERPDLRQRITTTLTGLPRKAARSKTPEFQAGLIDAVLDHGDVTSVELEEAFAPEDVAVYGPASEIWVQFRQRMPWGEDVEAHQRFTGWLLRTLLSDRSTLDTEMIRKPVLSAWDVRNAIDTRVWQEHIPADLRAQVDEARMKKEKARSRETYTARNELQIVTPELIAQHVPLADLVPVFDVAEQALFAPAEPAALPESGSFQTAPVSVARPPALPPRPLPGPPSRRMSPAHGIASLVIPRAVAR